MHALTLIYTGLAVDFVGYSLMRCSTKEKRSYIKLWSAKIVHGMTN